YNARSLLASGCSSRYEMPGMPVGISVLSPLTGVEAAMVLTMPPLVFPSHWSTGRLAGLAVFDVQSTVPTAVLGVSVMLPALNVTVVAEPLVYQHMAHAACGTTATAVSKRQPHSRRNKRCERSLACAPVVVDESVRCMTLTRDGARQDCARRSCICTLGYSQVAVRDASSWRIRRSCRGHRVVNVASDGRGRPRFRVFA